MIRTGQASGHKAQRTCLGCRQVLGQDDLLRYVLAPDGEIVVDYRGRLPGRGAYTCLKACCIEQAVRRRQFDRAFKGRNRPVDAPRLLAMLRRQIFERILNLLGMARKSGNVVAGSNMVLDALGSVALPALVLMAEDSVSGIAEKVEGKADHKRVPFYRMFDKSTLGQLMGKDERSVVALRPGALAESIKFELEKFKSIAGES